MKLPNESKIIEEEQILKQHLLSKAQISILLKSYNDIFSNFDPRPFGQRALSDDFLSEIKRASLDKQGALETNFLIPKNERNSEHEVVIKKRLRDHFKRHSVILEKEISSIRRRGIFMASLGVFFIMIAGYLLSLSSHKLFVQFMIVVLEPAGWFTAWTGLDEIYYTTRQKKPDLEFYHKMTQSEIVFHPY